MRKQGKGFGFIHYGILMTTVLSAIFGYNLFTGDMQYFLPGETTHGHHQIELQCNACHVESFQSSTVMQESCMQCHEASLNKARDTHPKKKFTDPRNADLLSNLDATQCVTCHIEHSPEITDKFGVTMPEDFCFYCHQKIADERKSHQDYAFDSCSNSGCHNYHDNRALYEKFLAKHLDEPSLLAKANVRIPNAVKVWLKNNKNAKPLSVSDFDGAQINKHTPSLIEDWAGSVHAKVQVNCMDCHDQENWLVTGREEASSAYLAIDSCSSCHQRQNKSFLQGLHGMRLSVGAAPMTVAQAKSPMKQAPTHDSLTCSSCHDPHKPDLQYAAVDACMQCHDDEHSRNFEGSVHEIAWQKEVTGLASVGTGVSCATCHMPRIKKGKNVFVEHNQSMTLEPNSKMLRPVCLNCHGLEFSTAALADQNLIDSNFSRPFDKKHPSFELVRQRIAEKKARRRSSKKAKN